MKIKNQFIIKVFSWWWRNYLRRSTHEFNKVISIISWRSCTIVTPYGSVEHRTFLFVKTWLHKLADKVEF